MDLGSALNDNLEPVMSGVEIGHAELAPEKLADSSQTFSEAQVTSMIHDAQEEVAHNTATRDPFYSTTPNAESLAWWYQQMFGKSPEFPTSGNSKAKNVEGTEGSIH
ncbi:hypothetical protein M404DRAFT_32992 [Pisolithus tinctorius Marx 270]|uniref:Uncharacterized protein n=1 Tax=Pisolithus tinctorius Marx 270 TaxID=870435 RepID=A0A0C3NMA9_PISTI|nr:hypothetical protein M404DRAFT_32992 [Pisolithus tinctorius Marx 270]